MKIEIIDGKLTIEDGLSKENTKKLIEENIKLRNLLKICLENKNKKLKIELPQIEESLRCKFSWEDCDNSYSSVCDYCERNNISKQKTGDYYRKSKDD